MAYPQPVPSLSEEEYVHFRREMDAFTVPDEMEGDLERHREAIEEDSSL
jgi:hypothetical protein